MTMDKSVRMFFAFKSRDRNLINNSPGLGTYPWKIVLLGNLEG